MEKDDKRQPAKPPDAKDRSPRGKYFNDDGNKVIDVEFVGESSPDTDPDERAPAPEPNKS
jgi:hypothetical protein